MAMKIMDYTEKGSDHSRFYLMAVIIGVIMAFLFLGGVKMLYLLIKFLAEHWIFLIVSVIALLFVRHLIKRRSRKIKQRFNDASPFR